MGEYHLGFGGLPAASAIVGIPVIECRWLPWPLKTIEMGSPLATVFGAPVVLVRSREWLELEMEMFQRGLALGPDEDPATGKERKA